MLRATVLFLLAGIGWGLFQDDQTPVTPASNIAFTQLHLGGGGAMNNIQAWSDGTKTVTSDTAGAYICYQCVNKTSKWQQVVLYSAIPSATIAGNPDGYGIYNFFVAPGNTKHGYLYFYGKVYYSTNLDTCASDGCPGLTWTASDLAPGNFGIANEKFSGPYGAVDPANDNIAYISTPYDATGVTPGMYRTTNGGGHFAIVTAVGSGALYTGAQVDNGNGGSMVCFDPKSSVVSSITQGIYIATNGGTSGGVWASADGGTTWTLTAGGPTKFVHIVCDQNGTVWATDNQTARTSGNHNLWKYSCASPPCGAGGTWTNITTDDATSGAINLTIAVDPSTSGSTTRVVTATNSGDQTNQSTDNGATWTGTSGNYASLRSQNTGSNPVPWLVATDQVNFSTGGEVFDPSQCSSSATCVLYQADGIGVWYNVGAVWPHLSFVEQTAGIENLTSGQAISPWGSHSHLVWTGLDRGFLQLPDPTVYAKIQGSGTGWLCGSFGNGGQISPAYGTQWAGNSDGQNGSLIISALIGGCGIFGYSTANGFGSVVTVSIASPAVVTCTGCNLAAGQALTFTADGNLPTGLTAFYSGLIPANGAAYYVTQDGALTANTFHISDTLAHALAGTNTINTSAAGTGTEITISTFIPFADNTPLTNGAFQGGCGAVNNGSGFPNFDVVWFNTRDQDGPWYSTNGGGSWTNLNSYFHTNFGVPLANTTSNGWGSGNGPFGTNWHCDSDKVNVNNFVVYNSGVSGGCDQTKSYEGFYHSSDGGATWTQFGHATVDCALGTGKTVRAVPGQAGEYYFSAGLNSANFSGTWPGAQKLWHITGSGSGITSCNNIVGVTSVDLGAPAPGHSYPAIYVYGSGNGSGITGVWRNIDGTCNTWTQLGNSPQPGNWLDAIYQVIADGNIYGQVYIMTHGSNLIWGKFN